MADPDRDRTEPPADDEPVDGATPGASSAPDEVTQQIPTQQTPAPPTPPTQETSQSSGYEQQGYGPGYGSAYETPSSPTPTYGPPSYQPPSYDAPSYGTPSYEAGGYPAAGYPGGYPTQPGYGYAARQTEPLAVWGLVVAIIAWVACPIPFVPAIIALVLAGNAQRNIDASGGAKEGRGINTATKIIAWINIGLWALVAIFVVVAIVASAAANA